MLLQFVIHETRKRLLLSPVANPEQLKLESLMFDAG
jgi:hypothetical protein